MPAHSGPGWKRRVTIDCDRCDGCGWYEGGKAIQTRCAECGGAGRRRVRQTRVTGIGWCTDAQRKAVLLMVRGPLSSRPGETTASAGGGDA